MEPNQEMPIENEGVDVSFVQNLAEKINTEIAKVVIGNHEIKNTIYTRPHAFRCDWYFCFQPKNI